MPKNDVEEQLAWCSTSIVLLGWVDGILQPLPMVVPSTAYKNNGHGMKDKHESDDEVHWVPPGGPSELRIIPKFQTSKQGEGDVME